MATAPFDAWLESSGTRPSLLLLAVTFFRIGSGLTSWAYVAIAVAAGALTARTSLPPILVLLVGAVAGVAIGQQVPIRIGET